MQQLEKDFSTTGAGRWAEIIKRKPGRPITLESDVLVPFSQAALLGLVVTLPVSAVTGVLTHSWQYSTAAAAVAFGTVTALSAFKLLNETLLNVWHTEEYISETSLDHTSEHAEVRISLTDNPQGHHAPGRLAPGGSIVYDTLQCSSEELALVTRAEALSKRALCDLGLSENLSMSLVSDLVKFGYANRAASNQPATWTSKGQALRRAFSQSAGGVLVVEPENSDYTSDTPAF